MSKNRYTVEIAGSVLNIVTEESEEYVLGLAKLIENRLTSILSAKKCTRQDAMLLCCMEFLDDKCKTKLALDEAMEQISEKNETDALREENLRLKQQLDDLRQKYIRG